MCVCVIFFLAVLWFRMCSVIVAFHHHTHSFVVVVFFIIYNVHAINCKKEFNINVLYISVITRAHFNLYTGYMHVTTKAHFIIYI